MKQSVIYVSLLWGIGLFLGSHCVFGQPLRNIRFHPFTTLHGLPASEITSFSEADNGFLWITSIDGISCFDGARFKNYRLPLVDSTAISGSNHVPQILCWKKQVWCLNRQGHFFSKDPKSDAFVYMGFSAAKKESKQANKNYRSFCFDETRNCFWTTEADSIVKIDLASGKKTAFWQNKAPINDEILLDSMGRLWFPTDAGEVCFNPKTKESTTFFQSSGLTTHLQRGAVIWCLGDLDTLYQINTQTLQAVSKATDANRFFEKQQPDCAQHLAFAPNISGDSTLWISTCGDGVLLLNVTNGRFTTRFTAELHEDEGFLHDWINRFCITRDGCLWLGSQKGIAKIDSRQQDFFTQKIPAIQQISASRIRQVLTNPSNRTEKWIATGEGLFLYDEERAVVVKSFLQRNPKDPDSKLWAKISAMYLDEQNTLWLATNGGLVRINPAFTVKNFIVPPPFKEIATDIVPQGEDAFWIKGFTQAGLYWPQRNQFLPVRFPSKVNLFNMNIGQGQSVFFSTDSAVFRVKLADFDTACACFPKPQKVCSVLFPSDLIENDTAIWVILPTGLAEFHKQKHVFRIFGEKEGLTNLRVRSILEDSKGQFWLNSDNGLFVFSPRYLRFKKYGETDGLADNFIPGILSKDGAEFHAGFDSRFSTFQPEERNHLKTVKPLITDVFALNERLPIDLFVTETPLVTIKQAQNILRFEFTCPDFYQSEKISFQYQLEGFDAAPVEAGTARTAVYTNLDGGRYRFLVWATNADGFRCEKPAVVLLQVVPPFYKTWWFGVAVFALILGFIVALFKYREQQRIQQENTRLRIARDLHDEVGSTLSTISILSESVSRNVTADKDKVRLTGIGEKARAAMENMSDIVWAINPQNDSMPQIIQRMTAYASETLEAANITLQFTVGQGVEHIRISTEKRKDFYLFFKEAVANSAKHSHAQRVGIVLEKKDKRLLFQIADDGVGLPENIQTLPTLNGNGLTNMAARAKILQADFSMHRPQKGGVVVRLSIPI